MIKTSLPAINEVVNYISNESMKWSTNVQVELVTQISEPWFTWVCFPNHLYMGPWCSNDDAENVISKFFLYNLYLVL